MESEKRKKHLQRQKRKFRVRGQLRKDYALPRLCVVKTNRHLYLQLIDDEKGVTVASASTCAKATKQEGPKKNCAFARKLGEQIATLAKAAGIKKVIFDRGMAKYHGILAAVADAAREGGLQF